MARKYLREIAKMDDSITISEIEILHHPRQTWKDGIRMIPALKIEDKLLSGLYLNKKNIAAFINESKK
jgi:hypothetical protein